jgi:glutamate racemase
VIATERTVRSRAFAEALSEIDGSLTVYEHATQPLVGLVESGMRDGDTDAYERETLGELLTPIKRENTDVLILGCTHFSSVAREISDFMGNGVRIIDAARIGAEEFIKSVRVSGRGRLCYTT